MKFGIFRECCQLRQALSDDGCFPGIIRWAGVSRRWTETKCMMTPALAGTMMSRSQCGSKSRVASSQTISSPIDPSPVSFAHTVKGFAVQKALPRLETPMALP